MSERGSFVTEYVNCDKCFDAMRDELLEHWDSDNKFRKVVQVDGYNNDGHRTEPLPILAGKIGGLGSGEELGTFEFELGPALAARICHPVRIAILPDSSQGIIITIKPTDAL